MREVMVSKSYNCRINWYVKVWTEAYQFEAFLYESIPSSLYLERFAPSKLIHVDATDPTLKAMLWGVDQGAPMAPIVDRLLEVVEDEKFLAMLCEMFELEPIV